MLYRFFRPIITFLMKVLYRIEIIGKENIPDQEGFILAGNHKSDLDCTFLISSTKRTIHFLAKKELIDGKLGWFFRNMELIPVDRQVKNKEAIAKGEDVLTNGGVIGIFPEATFNKTEYVTLPFKMGAVKMASDTNSLLVPFAIVGEYKLFHRHVKLIIGKPYHIKDKNDLKGENITLMNKVIKLMRNEYY